MNEILRLSTARKAYPKLGFDQRCLGGEDRVAFRVLYPLFGDYVVLPIAGENWWVFTNSD